MDGNQRRPRLQGMGSPVRHDHMTRWIEKWLRRRGPGPAARPILLVVGPESSGTRIFTDIFSRHPAALGSDAALRHQDLLDTTWQAVAGRRRRDAVHLLRALPRDRFIVTRRSMPHGSAPGTAARFCEFPDLDGFIDACDSAQRSVFVLVTTRSPAACMASSVAQRASVQGDPELARQQFHAACAAIFRVIARRRLPFLILSVEALVLDGADYVQSLFHLLGLGPGPADLPPARNPNTPRYREFPAATGVRP